MQSIFLKFTGEEAMERVFQNGKAMQEESILEKTCNLSELDCKVLDSVSFRMILFFGV